MTQTILKRKAKEKTVTLKWKNWITPGGCQHVRWDTSFVIPPSLSDYVLFISALIPGCKVVFWGLLWVTMNTVLGICWNKHPNTLNFWLVWCFFFFLFVCITLMWPNLLFADSSYCKSGVHANTPGYDAGLLLSLWCHFWVAIHNSPSVAHSEVRSAVFWP